MLLYREACNSICEAHRRVGSVNATSVCRWREFRLKYADRIEVAPATVLARLCNRLGLEERGSLMVLRAHVDKGDKRVIGVVVGRIMPLGVAVPHCAPGTDERLWISES